MPYPSRVDREQIVAAARQHIEQEGVDSLTLSKLAGTLGIKAPSLYRHIANKEALLQEVNLLTLRELFDALARAKLPTAAPEEQLVALMTAYRRFAHRFPERYQMVMTTKPNEGRPDENALLQMVLPLQVLLAEISGEDKALTALRGLLALAHGFVMLELNEQLQRGGDLEEAFVAVVTAYLRGW